MNSFLFTTITLCVVAQCALAHYQSAPVYGNGYQSQQQRKMTPTPQTYGQSAGYGMEQQQQYEPTMNEYEQQQISYKAPSSASSSQYDERRPSSNGYNKPAAASSNSRSYSAPSSGYAKPAAPKYEEPYHPPMPFAWGYDINDGYGGAQYHKENGDEYGKRTGSYGYTDAYGIYRQVDYVADENGFRATIKTNEPGTANESPADVELHAYEPPSNYYAGNRESSYGKQASGYSAAPAQGSSSYSSSPKAQTYGGAPRPSYKQQQQSSYAAPAQRYEQTPQYSGSSIVPVYQKLTPKAVTIVPKRY